MSDPLAGVYSTLGIGVEATEGTGVDPDLWFDISAETCRSEVSLHESPSLGLGYRTPAASNAVVSKLDNQVGFTCEPRFAHLHRLLGLAFGGELAGNTLTVGNAPKSFSLEVDKVAEIEAGKSVQRYTGCKVTKLNIASAANDSLKMSLEGIARAMTVVAGVTPDYSAWETQPPMMHHGLTIVSGPSEIPGGQIYDLSLDIETGVETDHFANALTRIAAPGGRLDVSGTLTVPWHDDSAKLWAKIIAATRFDLRFQWVGQDDQTLDLLLSCKASGDIPQIGERTAQKMTIPFICYRSGETDSISAVLGS
jgi:hypothetical protein